MAKPPKPFKSYDELLALLESRGMIFHDVQQAKKKIAQIGYYRLSGYWYIYREIERDACGKPIYVNLKNRPGHYKRLERLLPGVSFEDIIKLYLFDKRLRLLFLDAIERIEIFFKTVLAHELGSENPLSYTEEKMVNPSDLSDFTDKNGETRPSPWKQWSESINKQIDRSHEAMIKKHKEMNEAIPFWVIIEVVDFGSVSKYYKILRSHHQKRIADRMGVANHCVLVNWLQELNILRNCCAHHARIWNRTSNPIRVLEDPYFGHLNLTENARKRIYGSIAIVWYLITKMSSNSTWLNQVHELMKEKSHLPGSYYVAMGMPDETGFKKEWFSVP